MDWDGRFLERSPAFDGFAEVAQPLRVCREWPRLGFLQGLCDARGVVNAQGMPLRLRGEAGGDGYEARIYLTGEMHVREGDWHDLFNVLAWLAYPAAKAALNERHYKDVAQSRSAQAAHGARSRLRDALTLFDESGAIVVSRERDLLDHVRAFRWKELFWQCRQRAERSMRVFVIGHALAQKALAPYVGMTAHALLLSVGEAFTQWPLSRQLREIDLLAQRAIGDGGAFSSPRMLAPLPVLGVPGWWDANAQESFYDNSAYFRPGRAR
jgi:hypothetical protein